MKAKSLNVASFSKLQNNKYLWMSFVAFKAKSFIYTPKHEFNVSFKLLLQKFAIESTWRGNVTSLMWEEIRT